MAIEVKFPKWAAAASIGLSIAAGTSGFAEKAIEVPKIVARSIDRGPVNPRQESSVTVHLKLRDEAAFTKAVDDLYKQGSPTYHHWMTKADFAKYAPSAAEVESVKRELQQHGLSIVSVDPNNFSIRAHGSSANIERAFQTQIHEVENNGLRVRANVTSAKLTGSAGELVKSVTGLSGQTLRPYFKRQLNPHTGKATPGIPSKKLDSGGLASFFTNDCFGPSESQYITTAGSALPVGLFSGNSYLPGSTLTCAWTPAQLRHNYGLNSALQPGLNGDGQTIVIIDAPTNSDFAGDLATFSNLTGLPPITNSNFKVLYPDGVPTPFQNEYWDVTGETQLDIEWAHAFAPNAKIVLLIIPSQEWSEFEYAVQYAVNNKLGNIISLSYGAPEFLYGSATISGFNQVLKTAAAAGVAVNISSGDGGDEGSGAPDAGGASFPADSPYATSIGGTSIGLPGPNGNVEVGWGLNVTALSFEQDGLYDPPFAFGFQGGAGGGESTFIAKPSWQSKLKGVGRQQPDISAVADPQTGAVTIIEGDAYVVGGTSLSAPIFSAFWAMADQVAGKSLGQAAPLFPQIHQAIRDIAPLNSDTNVIGAIIDSTGTYSYAAPDLVPDLYTTTSFYSTLVDLSGDNTGAWYIFTFGTDSSLQTAVGWDNVTGYGIPKGLAFIQTAGAQK